MSSVVRLLICCPTSIEFENLRQHYRAGQVKRLEIRDGTRVQYFELNQIVVLRTAIGKRRTELILSEVLDGCRIGTFDVCIDYGGAGAISAERKVGDVLVTAEWRNGAQTAIEKLNIGMVGRVGTVDYPIESKHDRARMYQNYGWQAVTMETEAVEQLSHKHSVHFALFRVITDVGESAAREEFEKNAVWVLKQSNRSFERFVDWLRDSD